MKTFVKLWVFFMALTITHPVLAQWDAPHYRITENFEVVLSIDSCRKYVSTALAALERENKSLCKYIDSTVAPFIEQRCIHQDEGMKGVSKHSPFFGMASGTCFYRILFASKPEYVDKFPENYVAMVYLREDNGMPLGIKAGNSAGNKRLELKVLPVLKTSELMPLLIEVPNGQPKLQGNEEKELLTIAKEAIKKNTPDVFNQLIPANPIITQHLLYQHDVKEYSLFHVRLFCRGSVAAIVSIREDNKEVVGIRFESAMP